MKTGRKDALHRQDRQSIPKQPATSGFSSVDLLLQKAIAHHNAGQLPQAESLYRQILQISPNHFDALHLLGQIACQTGQAAVALELIDRAIQINPEHAEAHFNRGNALFSLQQYQAAVHSYDKAILLKPEYAEAHHNRGSALYALQQYQAALASIDKAILLKPDYAEAFCNRGNALHALNRYQAAVASFDKAIQLRPDYAEAYFNRGNVLQVLRQHDAALQSYEKAIRLNPDNADLHHNRASALYALQQYQAALLSFDKAVLLKPDCAEACCNRGNTLYVLQQYQAALENYDKALLLRPDYADAYYNRGNTLLDLKQCPAALASYDKALLLKPDYEYLRGMRLFIRRLLCDWNNIESECRQLEAHIGRGLKVAQPFAMLALTGSPAAQKQAAQIYMRDAFPARSSAAAIPRRPKRDRVRIGYFSADYYNHAMSYLMAELYERHDRSRFEILGFSIGPEKMDEMRRRVSAAMDHFLDLRSRPDREVAELCRKLEVDIAVDLNGFTKHNRAGIFAGRAAPIQVSYLGYPGTMGADFMDYLIADPTLIPEASQTHYSEKIVYLPDSYQVNDSQRPISAKPCERASEGLPESAFVFCCFNNAYKISPSVFDIWMRVLGRVEGSVLWLFEDNPWAVDSLRNEAARRGIAPQRLVFAKSQPVAEHLARHQLADLFLDTLPYNAHTTASDALWAGLPLVTRTGETFAGRVAASLLCAVGLPELITTTESEYEELAVELAHNPQRLHTLHQRLQQNRPTAPLFDCASFTRHLEAAYTAIVDRYHAGLPPDHIHIPRCR
jgi:predicted O-linked N-acetylglucosamine transferase (SPINDLY family)/regulator of sirC expression with transglutaminase-like and TPR domain